MSKIKNYKKYQALQGLTVMSWEKSPSGIELVATRWAGDNKLYEHRATSGTLYRIGHEWITTGRWESYINYYCLVQEDCRQSFIAEYVYSDKSGRLEQVAFEQVKPHLFKGVEVA